MKNFIYKITRSSNGSGDLSMSVKAGMIAMVPLAIALAPMFGIPLGGLEGTLMSFIDAIVNVIDLVGKLVAAVMITYGMLRKAFYFIFPKV